VAGDYASELESVARELRRQADGVLFRDLTRAMRDGVEPAQAWIRDGLEDYLPRRGGYAATVASDLDLPVSVSTTGRDPGVSIFARTTGAGAGRRGRGRRRYKRLDGGLLEHPVFGDRSRWVKQTKGVTPGFFTRPCIEAGPEVEARLEAALRDVAHVVDARAAGR
jgi:hypothetical protein